jgi:hypothetical protein
MDDETVYKSEFCVALTKAVKVAIEEIGIEKLKKLSWFMSNRK